MSDDADEGYNEFIKEYGSRYEWDNEGNPEFIPEWQDWEDLFCEIKIYWKTKAVRHWREETLKRFVYSLPSVRNSTSLFHVLLQSDVIYLPQILSLIELPYYSYELREEIWPDGIDKNEIKVDDNADEIDKFRYGLLLQGEDSIVNYYSKIKRCNDVIKLCKNHLRELFHKGLSSESQRYIERFGCYYSHDLDPDKMVEMLIQAEKENAPDFITAFSDCLRQVSNVQISTQSGSTCEKAYIKHVELMQNKESEMSDTIITLNCLLLPCEIGDRSNLSEGSVTTLKISTNETVDQLRIMIRERWPHLFEKVPPAEFLLWKINDTEGVTSIEKQIEKFVRGERLNETGMPPHELTSRRTYPCYCKIATSQLGRGVVVESIPLRPTTDIREATI
ncbi:hypothetical protein GLOIN_2v1765706 [Rhizophagus irregularis DAOM 181602=DAOM 197198]|nr:hypothetical protein GLOIN_2v1765706 [Rhizophagus irregularis DAOM 181602=DAOM 197198]